MRVIIEDSRQQKSKHDLKHEWWSAHRVTYLERYSALPFGDYMADDSNVCIDTKRNIAELAQNLSRDHNRFTRELIRAFDAGYRLIVLVETNEVSCLDELSEWVNPVCRRCDLSMVKHCNPLDSGTCDFYGKRGRPLQGERMVKMIRTIESKYGARFKFCHPQNSAMIICDLLGVEYA